MGRVASRPAERSGTRGYGGPIDADALTGEICAVAGVAAAAVTPRADGSVDLVAVPTAGLLLRYLEACAGDAQAWVLPTGMVACGLNGHELAYMAWEQGGWDTYRLRALDRPGAVVVDAGANVGLFALLAARRSPNARVYAIEPMPPLLALVAANARLHDVDDQVVRCASALGPQETTATFAFAPFFSALSSRHAEERAAITRRLVLAIRMLLGKLAKGTDLDVGAAKEWIASQTAETTIEVPVVRLSSLVREHRIERVDLLKIDVEGSELLVLDGIDDDDWERIARVAIEVNDVDDRVDAVATRLRSMGMTVEVEADPSASHATPARICIVHGSRGPVPAPVPPAAADGVVTEAGALADAQALADAVRARLSALGVKAGEVRLAATLAAPAERPEPPFVEAVGGHLAHLLGVEAIHLAAGWWERSLVLAP